MLFQRPIESNVDRRGREYSNSRSNSPSLKFKLKRKSRGRVRVWTDIKRAVFPEEVITVAALEGAVPPSNSNANDKKNQRREVLQQQ